MSKQTKTKASLHVTGYAGNDPWGAWNHCEALSTETRRMAGKRDFTVVLSRCGQELARRTELSIRGRVTDVHMSFAGVRNGH